MASAYSGVLSLLSYSSVFTSVYNNLLCNIACHIITDVPFHREKRPIEEAFLRFLGGVFSLITAAISLMVYMNGGTVRDVPELGIDTHYVYRNMNADYNDRIYRYDLPFADDGTKIKVLLIGNSFTRDMANVLLESTIADRINMSYIYMESNVKAKKHHAYQKGEERKWIDRIKEADCILYFGLKNEIPSFVWPNLKPDTEIWGIGTKNYGSCMGHIYSQRNRPDYFKRTITVNPMFYTLNNKQKKEWGPLFIDFIEVTGKDGKMRVFTEDGKLLSQDCHHLTKAGAKYYADNLDLERIFSKYLRN